MTKMNRRNYLKGLGATAGAIASMPKLDALGQERQRASKQTPAAITTPDWPIGMSLPVPTVELIFVGIMGFRYDALNQRCEIGIHHGSPTHRLKVLVVENPSTELYNSETLGLDVETSIDFGITGKPSNVSFLQATGPLNRTNSAVNSQDFRWLIDIEHPDFLGFRMPFKSHVYRKRLFVKQGVFYTRALTCAKFDVIGSSFRHLNIHIPRVIGASLALNPGECVFLNVNGRPVLRPDAVCQATGKTYSFFFTNNCANPNGDGDCEHSDFHLNFDAIDIPHHQRFEILLKQRCPRAPSNPFGAINEGILQKAGARVRDEAPCMGLGFGQGGDFPPYPPG